MACVITIVVGAAVVDDVQRPTRLLAARRTAPARLAGRWELPGGKVEPGEGAVAALRRELVEELGIEVEVGAEIVGPDAGAWPLGDGPLGDGPLGRTAMLRVWLVRVAVGEPVARQDHDALRWLGPGQWLDVPWLPGDRPVVRALLRRGHVGAP